MPMQNPRFACAGDLTRIPLTITNHYHFLALDEQKELEPTKTVSKCKVRPTCLLANGLPDQRSRCEAMAQNIFKEIEKGNLAGLKRCISLYSTCTTAKNPVSFGYVGNSNLNGASGSAMAAVNRGRSSLTSGVKGWLA